MVEGEPNRHTAWSTKAHPPRGVCLLCFDHMRHKDTTSTCAACALTTKLARATPAAPVPSGEGFHVGRCCRRPAAGPARASSWSGIWKPNVLAVLRMATSSNLVDCKTGGCYVFDARCIA